MSDQERAWNVLQADFPWPHQQPSTSFTKEHGWLSENTRKMLSLAIRKIKIRPLIAVELGSWMGRSARFMLRHGVDWLICIDHWKMDRDTIKASPDYRDATPEELRKGFEHQCWGFKNRIVILQQSTTEGLRAVAKYNLTPHFVYIDASHDEENVRQDVFTAEQLFPSAILVGDDWKFPGIQKVVHETSERTKRQFQSNPNAWILG